MTAAYRESPFNTLPAAVWLLAAPIIASEALFGLAGLGFISGAQGVGMRVNAVGMTAYLPEFGLRAWALGEFDMNLFQRMLTYPFIHGSFVHAAFVLVFTLALGKLVAEQFRPWAFVALFFGSAIGAAVIYTLAAGLIGGRAYPLIGGYPAVYGLVGAFTFILWVRLGMEHANRLRAFSLIGMLLLFQLVFGLLQGGGGYVWIADVSGFAVGFALSFVLIPGGFARAMRAIRHR
ncbi:MAG: rhomboid family intramembrane serine protease [Paracoccus sp. (in: a-proteobacteria)]|nr:rhomboid family intramembrane serine protease [Paracoccus sp. (in: a-proteobacteria)]